MCNLFYIGYMYKWCKKKHYICIGYMLTNIKNDNGSFEWLQAKIWHILILQRQKIY